MIAMLRSVEDHGNKYEVLAFVCPGCIDMHPRSTGLHMLPVNSTTKFPSWDFDGNLDAPTLSPSILTGRNSNKICHSFLRNGVLEFLGDCNHSLANQSVPLPELPEWVTQSK